MVHYEDGLVTGLLLGQPTLISLFGFQGIGKKSLSQEAVKRLFEGGEFVGIDVSTGTALTELALRLNASIRIETLNDAREVTLALVERAKANAKPSIAMFSTRHNPDQGCFTTITQPGP